MAFHVGQKVVCVKDGGWSPHYFFGDLPAPEKGEVVTISGLYSEPAGDWFLMLKEYRPDTQSFWAIHFRPLQEQGMSILRAILADPKVKIKETA